METELRHRCKQVANVIINQVMSKTKPVLFDDPVQMLFTATEVQEYCMKREPREKFISEYDIDLLVRHRQYADLFELSWLLLLDYYKKTYGN